MVSWAAVLCSFAVVLGRARYTSCVSTNDLFPYGTEHGDFSLDESANGATSVGVNLAEDFTFLGETFSTLQVSVYGVLGLGAAVNPTMEDAKMIAPYFGDVNATSGHNVFYRSTNDSALLQQVANIISENFGEPVDLHSLFIATWHHIPASGGPVDKHNTFQCVLAYREGSDSRDPMSYALFLYEDGGVQWSRGSREDSQYALVGFSNGNDHRLLLPTSRTDAVLKVAAAGNTGVAGKWLFRIDQVEVVLPAPLVGFENTEYPPIPETSRNQLLCVVIHAGTTSKTFSLALRVNGENLNEISFEVSGLTRQCATVPIVDDNKVEYNETLTVELLSTDDGYPTIFPSTAVIAIVDDDIEVGWERSEYNVTEGGNLEICAEIMSAHVLPKSVLVAFKSTEVTAGSSDFVTVIEQRTFDRDTNPLQCINLRINSDTIPEYDEILSVSLETEDEGVTIPISTVNITILDDDEITIYRSLYSSVTLLEDSDDSHCLWFVTGPSERRYSVGLRFTDGSALAGIHFVDTSGDLTFEAHTTQLCIPITIISNDVYDIGGRDFTATVYTSTSSHDVHIHIEDNDAKKVEITHEESIYQISEDGGSVNACVIMSKGEIGAGGQIEVLLTSNSDGFPEFEFQAYIDDVNGRRDFGLSERVARFAPGDYEPKCINIPIWDDDILEDRETFYVQIRNLTEKVYNIKLENALVMIVDNDNVTATVELTEVVVTEDRSSNAEICAIIHGKHEIEFQMEAVPSGGNATARDDYRIVNNPIKFHNMQTRSCTYIRIENDFDMETLYENFFVELRTSRSGVYFDENTVEVFIKDLDELEYSVILRNIVVNEGEAIDPDRNRIGLCFLLRGALAIEVPLFFHTADDTAIAHEDYMPFNNEVVIRPEDISSQRTGIVCSPITNIVDDIILEGNESFIVTVTSINHRVQPQVPNTEFINITIVDNDRVEVYPSSTMLSVNESSGHVRVCATMIGLTERPIDIIMITSDGTAKRDVDYRLENNIIHFPSYLDTYGHLNASTVAEFSITPPRTERCGAIAIVDDEILEEIANKQFTVRFDTDSLPPGVQMTMGSELTVTIHDDDRVVVSMSVANLTVMEDAQHARIQLVVDGEADYVITGTIKPQAVPSLHAATAGSDYGDVERSVEIPAHYTSGSPLNSELTIPIRDDNLLEDLEKFEVTLKIDDSRVLVGEPQVTTIWIEDNDRVEVTLAAAEFRVLESADSAKVCIELAGATGKDITGDITSSPGTARANFDYTPQNSTFTFPPSSDSRQSICIDFHLIDDTALESVESFFVTIVVAVPRVDVGLDTATVRLVDDDGVYVGLTQSVYTVEENGPDGRGGIVDVCVQMRGVIERNVTISLLTEPGDADAGIDFVAVNKTILFPPSDSGNRTSCIEIIYLNDDTVENTEKFHVQLNTSGRDDINIDVVINRAQVLIIDSDTVSIDLEHSFYTTTEGDEKLKVCVVLGDEVERDISVEFTTVADTAHHYYDFLQTDSQLVFKPQNTTPICTSITIMDDQSLEDEEHFTVEILISDPAVYIASNTTSKTSTALVAIKDNDRVTVSLESSVYRVNESESRLSLCSMLHGATSKTIPISLSTQPGTAEAVKDYVEPLSEFVFTPSTEPQQRVCVEVLVEDDDILEEVETFHLEITTAVPNVTITLGRATVSVVDDDSVHVSLVRSEQSVMEEDEEGHGGEVEVCLRLTGVLEKAVQVELFTESDTARAGIDFLDSRQTIEFSPSPADNQTTCRPFSVFSDTIVESTETFLVKLTATDPYVNIDVGKFTISILDTDRVSINFVSSAYSGSEAEEELRVCVELKAVVERAVTAQLTSSNGTAQSTLDYTPVNAELSFQPGATTRLCRTVHIENDTILEDEEYFFLNLFTTDSALYTEDDTSGSSNSSTVIVVITDDDSVSVSLLRDELAVEEESGSVDVCVVLTGDIEREVTVTLSTEAGTANADADYVQATRSLVFHPTQSQMICTNFSIIDDSTVEETENFIVQLTGEDRVIPLNDRTRIFINDTDVVDVDFSQSTYSVSETDGEVTVCVNLDAEVEKKVTVELVTIEETAQRLLDFAYTHTEVMFEPRGDIKQCISIPITDDVVVESKEEFFVYLFDSDRSRVADRGSREDVQIDILGSGGGVEVITGEVKCVVVIEDDDKVRIGMEHSQYEVVESEGNVHVCLVLEGVIERSVDVSVQTEVGTARGGLDYVHMSQVVTFVPPSERWCVRVILINDEDVERNEVFTVRLSNRDDTAVTLNPRTASVRIIDEDVKCPRDVTRSPRGEYVWERTRPDLIELPCQHRNEEMEEMEGMEEMFARRRCNDDGKWGEVDVDDCYGEVEDLFNDIEKRPFNCKNFHELLRIVEQATKEEKWETSYVAIVARFFSDFADITERDGYVVEKHTCLDGVDSFTVGVKIIDQLFVWPSDILWTNSTSIIRDFETISEQLVLNPESATKTIPLSNIAFSSTMDERKEEDGITRVFSANKNDPLKIATNEPSEDDSNVLGTIHLPSSLFGDMDKKASEIGVWFSLHKDGSFFPLPDSATINDSVATPIISAAVGGEKVQNLKENIEFSLLLLKKEVTDIKCASWSHVKNGWTEDGCVTKDSEDKRYVVCSCNHLTNFAALGARLTIGSIEPPEPNKESNLTLTIISLVGAMLAILGLTLTLFTLIAFGKLRRRRTTILRAQLCSSLLFLLLGYLGHIFVYYTTTLPQDIPETCTLISIFTHYFTITSLMWLGAEALLMFRKLAFGKRYGNPSNLYFIIVSIVTWLLPFPFATIPALLNRDGVITEDEYCFISSLSVFVTTFIIPAFIAIIFNVVVYIVVVVLFIRSSYAKQQPEMTERMKKKVKSRKQAITRLFYSTPIIATFFLFAWIFSALTFVTSEASIGFHLLSAFFSGLLGWFIFVYYIATAKDTRKLVHDAFCRQKQNLNTHEFLSMESLGRASGIDESDSDSDYPERERRYGEFDVTYIGRKSALIEQKFTIGFKADGADGVDRDDTTNGVTHAQPELPPPAEDTLVSSALNDDKCSSPEVPGSPEASNRTRIGSIHKEDLAAMLEGPKAESKNSGSVSGSPHTSEEDVDSCDYLMDVTGKGSPESPLPPAVQVVFTTSQT